MNGHDVEERLRWVQMDSRVDAICDDAATEIEALRQMVRDYDHLLDAEYLSGVIENYSHPAELRAVAERAMGGDE